MPEPVSAFPIDDEPEAPPRPFEIAPRRSSALSAFPNDDTPDPLRQTLGQAATTAPDQAARIYNLRIRTGLPSGVIERNLDEIERSVARADFDAERFRRETPLLTKWLQDNPQHAQLAHDDLEPLGALERTLQVGRRTAGALSTGPMAISAGFWGGVRMGAEIVGAEDLAEFARGSAVVADYLENRLRGDRAGAGFVENAIYGGLESLSLTASALPAAAVTGPAGLVAVLGSVTAGRAYTQARDKGQGVGASTAFALGQGAIEAATEYIPAKWFFKDLAQNAALREVLKHQLKEELVGEEIATALQDLNEWAFLERNDGKTFMDYLRERPSAAAETAIATVVAAGGQSVMVRVLEAASGKPATQQVVEDLHAAAQASKTRERAPEAFRGLVERAAVDGLTHVYAPAETFTEYFQSKGEDPAQLATELTGDPDAYRIARATNGDLAIPTATYLTRIAGSGHETFFAQELRLTPNAENARETKARIKAAADAGSVEQREATAAARQQIFEAMVAKLSATGRFTPEDVEHQAGFVADAFGALVGSRDPAAIFRRFEASIDSEGGVPMAMPARPAAPTGVPDIPSSAARPNETAEQRAARRAGHLEALTAALTRDAQQIDPTVDAQQIGDELERRLSSVEERRAAARESGRGQELLRAIAEYGGVWWEKNSGAYKGEIEHLLESRDIAAVKAGSGRIVHKPGRKTWNGIPGVFHEEGLTPDGMVEALRQDPRFEYIEDINGLLDAVDEAMRAEPDADVLPGTSELRALGVRPGTAWWQRASETSQNSENVDESDAIEPAGAVDTSFDVTEFEQRDRERELEDRITAARQGGREDLQAVQELQELREAAAEVTARFQARLAQPDAENAYGALPDTEGGKVLNVDDARELSEDYVVDPGRWSDATHGPASAFIKQLWKQRLLRTPTGSALLLAGGGGSGKTSIRKTLVKPLVDAAEVVFDGVLGDYARTVERVQDALVSGRTVAIAYVHLPFRQALARAITRAQREGRTVPLDVLAADHAGAQDTILRLADRYRDNPRVTVRIYDNAAETPTEIAVEDLAAQRYAEEGESVQDTAARLLQEAQNDVRLGDLEGRRSDGVDGRRSGRDSRRPRGTGTEGARTETGRGTDTGSDDLAQGDTRGPRGTFNPDTYLIRLLARADRTTFIHELAHWFLEIKSQLALEADATPRERADMEQLLRWFQFDGDVAAWRALTHEQRRAHHEKFAEGFIDYLHEGKAPTPAMQSYFARFRSWIIGAYRTLRRRGVELTPQVREVMDRMVATEAAIAAAEADAQVAPLFIDAAAAGVSDQEFEGYRDRVRAASDAARARLQARLMRELAREDEEEWRRQRERVRAEVAAQVAEQPVYRAMAGMRGQLEGAPKTPFSKPALVAQFGRDILAQLQGLFSQDSGLPADAIAEIFGFPSGQALVDAILDAPPRDALVDKLTDDRMREEHGDLLRDPAQLAAEAETAIAGEHRDKVVRAELAMLNKLRAAAAPSVRAAKAEQRDRTRAGAERLRTELPDEATLRRVAEQTIAGMKLPNIRPDRFLAAARRGSRIATEAAAKQDFDRAIEGKQTELTNLALYRAAVAAREAVEEAREKFRTMFVPDGPLAKRRNMDYVHAARAIAAQYFFPEKRLGDARDALALVEKHDGDLYRMLDEQMTAARAGGPDLQSLTYESFLVMRDAVDALWEQSLRQQQMLVDGQLIDRNEAAAAILHRLDELGTAPTQYDRGDTKLTSAVLGLRAALRRVEHWVDYMDGGNPNGVFRRYIWNPVVEGINRYRTLRGEFLQQYLELIKPIEATLVPGQIAAPELGFTFDSRVNLLHALLHTGNESNFQKLLRGRNWGALQEDGTVDASKWRAFIQRMHREGVITKADWEFVQGVWDLLEGIKPEVQRAHRELYGHYFSEITAWPVETPFGTYRGGYVPAMVDPDLASEAADRSEERAAFEGGDNAFIFPTTGRGATMRRVEAYAKPLALDLRSVPQHLDWALRFIHIQPCVRDVGRLLMTYSVRDRLAAYDPKARGQMLLPWLQRAASQQVSQPGKFKEVDAFWRAVRTRTGLNMMAGHVVNTLQQATGLSVAKLKVGRGYLRNALWRYLRDHKQVVDFILESSEMMRTRVSPQAMEMLRTIDDLLLNPSQYEKLRDYAERHGYFMQAGTQNAIDKIVWLAAYEEAREQDPDHAAAVRRADSAVRQTQGSFAPEDMARVEVQTPFVRAFTMFSGYFNMLANVNGTEFAKVVRDIGLRRGAGRGLYIYAFGLMIPAVIGEVILQAFGGFDVDDDEWYLDDALRLFFGAQLRTIAAMAPGVGPGLVAIANHFNDQPYDDRISTSPAITMIEGASRAPHSVYKAIAEDGSKKRAVRDVLDAVGLLTGLPAGAIKRPAGYLADVVDEREQPEDLVELTRGLVSGRGAEPR